MDMSKYTGDPMGSGNPPGQHRSAYTSQMNEEGNFNRDKSYRGDMHVGINATATDVGNQPKEQKTSGLISNNPALR